MMKPKVLLLGKLPPPYIGPAIATQILLNSSLTAYYNLLHVNTAAHDSISAIGKWSFSKVRSNLAIYGRLIGVLRREKPDLVLVPISQSTIGFLKDSVFILLSRLFGRRTLLQLRGSNLKNWLAAASWPERVYVESVVRTTQGVIVLGENLRYLFADYFPPEHIFVVPNGANYQIPVLDKQQRNGRARILYLANLLPSKGIEDLLRGVSLLNARGVNSFTLDVVGTWADERTKRSCLEIAKEGALPVTFHAATTGVDKFSYFARADIFAFVPREPEGHPWVIVEAMAAGLPIVSTDQGAICESVLDGENGFLVDAQSPEQIAECLQLLLERPEVRRRFGAASRTRYLQYFTEEKMVERLRGAIDTLVNA